MFSTYSSLWSAEVPAKVKEYLDAKPSLGEVASQIKYYIVRHEPNRHLCTIYLR